MNKRIGIIIIAIIAGLFCISIIQKSGHSIKMSDYDLTGVIEGDDYNGGFTDLINGDPDAPVKIVEYGNYQCTACAPLNPYINEIVEEYDGKVAVIFRTMSLDGHPNGTASAAAALAASRQGYWKEYKDLLFENQDDWFYSDGETRQQQFESYFLTVSLGKGDLEQFRTDMASNDVADKIKFDDKTAQYAGVSWTPYFMVDGELVSQINITRDEFLENLHNVIDAKLAEKATE